MCMFHGLSDVQVPYTHSKTLYDKLTAVGVEAELHLIEGAGHADRYFVEDEVKAVMVKFLDRVFRRG